jgi:RimJ/RimL family protein N-acetyltransferase
MKKITESQRLYLQEFNENDLDLIAPLFADPAYMEFQHRGPMNRDEAKAALGRIIERYTNDGTGPWALFLKTNDEFLGFCGLPHHTIDGLKEVEIGYGLNPKHWGHGYATEAVMTCRDYGFQHENLSRMISIINPANTKSTAVATRAGLQLEKKTLFYQRTVDIYSIDRNTWMKLYKDGN